MKNKVDINHYLKRLSYHYFLSKNQAETKRISASVKNLKAKLNRHLGDRIHSTFIFGSYDRGTILPRSVDRKSDVDLMVVFDHSSFERTPSTYRKWLLDFATKCYAKPYGSTVKRSHPTITLRLGNIDYDLVPARYKEAQWWARGDRYFIPDALGKGWQATDPKDVKQKLLVANKRYQYRVKPIVRLLKAWNAYKGYPYASYDLELFLTNMYYLGSDMESSLLYAARSLPLPYGSSLTKRNKVASLRKDLTTMQAYLNKGNRAKALNWLHRSFPRP